MNEVSYGLVNILPGCFRLSMRIGSYLRPEPVPTASKHEKVGQTNYSIGLIPIIRCVFLGRSMNLQYSKSWSKDLKF